ncbi:MAG: F0F1 ATP synthase subunit A, partial [Candidatus Dormibacteraeota bacterium]|nr:F0F1 ATP synthase subunit A [Candidatus Dormibacteraeota bacterium]
MIYLAEGPPGSHALTSVCGTGYWNLQVIKFYYCSVSIDTLLSSALAIVVTLAIAFGIAFSVRRGVPGKMQMVLEFLLDFARGLVHDTVSKEADFVIPLAATIGLYILVANWLDFLPLPKPFLPANADLNQTLAMAMVVFVLSQGYAIKVRGIGGYLRHYLRAPFPPLTIIEEIVKPITLSLRLFGNLFAGLLMVYLLTQLPAVIAWLPVVLWKAFDVFFVGTIQAFIFMLLTIIYFGQAREGVEEHEHGAAKAPTAAAPSP